MLILIAGESGIGKTTLIDYLLQNNEDYFEQPICFTSRPRRSERERYIFAEKEYLSEAFKRGELLNLDEVFNEYYGISRDSTIEIIRSDKHAVKEVHPNNFKKFENCEFELLKVLIVSKHMSSENQKFISRNNRDESYLDYESTEVKYDIFLNISGLTPAAAANALILRIYLFISSRGRFPHPSLIDDQNQSGYNKVAHEFYDELRVTTKNFHDASYPFWEMAFESILTQPNEDRRLCLLEIGSGNGWLFNTFRFQDKFDIDCLDISVNMNARYGRHYFVASSRCIPVKSGNYDYVVGSLCDPFLYPESIADIQRVLKPGGLFLLTYPSKTWAEGLPSRNGNSTVFYLKNSQKVEVFSFCDFKSYIEQEGKEIGFALLSDKSYHLGREYKDSVAEAIMISANHHCISPLEMPILTALICKKV